MPSQRSPDKLSVNVWLLIPIREELQRVAGRNDTDATNLTIRFIIEGLRRHGETLPPWDYVEEPERFVAGLGGKAKSPKGKRPAFPRGYRKAG